MTKHIKDIIFFEDYGLWAKITKKARIDKTTPTLFIAKCVEDFINKSSTDKIEINYPEELHEFCEKETKKHKCTIAQFMEACCCAVIEPEKVKDKWHWWELPRA